MATYKARNQSISMMYGNEIPLSQQSVIIIDYLQFLLHLNWNHLHQRIHNIQCQLQVSVPEIVYMYLSVSDPDPDCDLDLSENPENPAKVPSVLLPSS